MHIIKLSIYIYSPINVTISSHKRLIYKAITEERVYVKKEMLSFLLTLLFLVGCIDVKGEFDIEGKIIKIDKDRNQLLIENSSTHKLWIDIPEQDDITKYKRIRSSTDKSLKY